MQTLDFGIEKYKIYQEPVLKCEWSLEDGSLHSAHSPGTTVVIGKELTARHHRLSQRFAPC